MGRGTLGRSVTGRETLGMVWDRSGDRSVSLGEVQGTLGEVWDGSGDPREVWDK